MKIPRIIHQSWKTKEIPYDIYRKEWVESWKRHHPDWEYRLWTDEDNREFIARYYRWFLSIYDGYKHPICRADAARYFYLFHYGGLYADLDFECLKNVEPLLGDYGLVLSRMGSNDSFRHSISNAILMSSKHNIFWLLVFILLIKRRNYKYVEDITGPVVVFRAVALYRKLSWLWRLFGGVKIYPPKYLCPVDWQEKGVYNNSLDAVAIRQILAAHPEAYAITYWTHNWK